MLREHLESIANRIRNIGESKSYSNPITKQMGELDEIILMVGYIPLPVTHANCNGIGKEFCENLEMLDKKIRPYFLKTVISTGLILYLHSNSFAENEIAEKKSLIEKIAGVGEAQAMTLPAPQQAMQLTAAELLNQITNKTLFISYINRIIDSRLSEKKFTREDFEKVPIYRGYYAIDDKKDRIEEKVMQSVNRSKWKDNLGIDKISTKADRNKIRFKIKFKQYMNRERDVTLDISPEGKAELTFNHRW